jgi:hypothetical protein
MLRVSSILATLAVVAIAAVIFTTDRGYAQNGAARRPPVVLQGAIRVPAPWWEYGDLTVWVRCRVHRVYFSDDYGWRVRELMTCQPFEPGCVIQRVQFPNGHGWRVREMLVCP